MSYDLVFWNQHLKESRAAQDIYTLLCTGGTAPDLQPYDLDALLKNLKVIFPSVEKINSIQINWESEDDSGSFLAEFTETHIIFQCFRLSKDRMNAIIDAAFPLGLRLFDPQVGKRFAPQ